MQPISNKTGHISIREAFLQDRNIGNSTKNDLKKANTASLLNILKQYNVNIDLYSNKDRCPFSFHKNGLERSASFYYYKDTNSFNCFGCNHGGGPVEFVSLIEDISKEDAARKINNDYETSLELTHNFTTNFEITQKIMLDFSQSLRSFIHNNIEDDKAPQYAEKISFIFDVITSKHNLDIEGLKSIIKKLVSKLNQYNNIDY
jgi:DNA primase